MPDIDQAGLSAQRLQRLDRLLRDRYVETGAIPGGHIQVWRRGVLAHSFLTGSMDLERGKSLREDAIYRIYSMTKPITGVALMMLAEEGLIDLQDDVARYIPEWRDLRVFAGGVLGEFKTKPPERQMKVVDLATHTAGLTYSWWNQSNVDAAYRALNLEGRATRGGLDAFINGLADVPLEFSPGTAYHYSVSIDVLGYIVQKLSGMKFGEFLRTRIFEPLGMVDTAFNCPVGKLDRLTSCYVAKPGEPLELDDDAADSAFGPPPQLESGGGGLLSTMADYMRFCRMLLNGGELDGVRLLSPKTVALFGTNLMPEGRNASDMLYYRIPGEDENLLGCGYSVCCATTIDLGRRRMPASLGDFFWSGAAMTSFWIDPREELAVVFMTQVRNAPNHNKIQRELRQIVYGAFTEANA
jgi:CubicO group peptidase (beta-lactamase class C family)